MQMSSNEIKLEEIKGDNIEEVKPVVMDDGTIVLVLSVYLRTGWHNRVLKIVAVRLDVTRDSWSLSARPPFIHLNKNIAVIGKPHSFGDWVLVVGKDLDSGVKAIY